MTAVGMVLFGLLFLVVVILVAWVANTVWAAIEDDTRRQWDDPVPQSLDEHRRRRAELEAIWADDERRDAR